MLWGFLMAQFSSRVLLAALVLSGCRSEAPQKELDPKPPGSSVPAIVKAQSPAVDCFARGMTGKIGQSDASLRLLRKDKALQGSYFYNKVGSDLALTGSVTDNGFVLEEQVGGKVTGKFDGTCETPERMKGTWTSADGKRSLSFEFAVPTKLEVVARVQKFKTKAKSKSAFGDSCTFERSLPVIFGAKTGDLDGKLQASVDRFVAKWGMMSGEYEADAKRCSAEGEQMLLVDFNANFSVVPGHNEVLILQFGGYYQYAETAHPTNAAGASVLNLDLATGKEIEPAEIFTKFDEVLRIAKNECTTNEDVASYLGDAFYLLPDGIRVAGVGFPHAMAVYTYQGPVLSYGGLLGSGLLRSDSPQARLWKSVTPNKAPCDKKWTPSDGG